MTFREQMDTDLAAMLSTDEWAETVTYHPAFADDIEMNAIFDESYLEANPETGAAVQSRQPRLTVMTSDLGNITPAGSDRVTVRETVYGVFSVQSDGQGITEIKLRKV